jgi:hypothetical protein
MTRPLLDWSDPNRTPREPCSRPVSGDGGPPRGRADADLSPASAHPLTGSLAHYDALADAVARYRSTWGRPAYEAMRDAATRCGMPQGEPPLAWSVRRLATYQHMMEQA